MVGHPLAAREIMSLVAAKTVAKDAYWQDIDSVPEVNTSAIQSGGSTFKFCGQSGTDAARMKCVLFPSLQVQWLDATNNHLLWAMAEIFGCTPVVALT